MHLLSLNAAQDKKKKKKKGFPICSCICVYGMIDFTERSCHFPDVTRNLAMRCSVLMSHQL